MNGFETIIENCPECGEKLAVQEIPGQRDPFTKLKKRILSCPKCGWKARI